MGGGGSQERMGYGEMKGTDSQEGKEQFGVLQGFLPQDPGKAGEQLYQDVGGASSSWRRAQSRVNGGGGVMMMGYSYMGEGSHWREAHFENAI